MIEWNDYPFRDHFKIPPTQMDEYKVFPLESEHGALNVTLNQGKEFVADFSVETVGRCFFTFEGEAEISVVYGESREELFSEPECNSNDWYTIPKDSFTVTNECSLYKSSSRRGFRYIRIICESGTAVLSELLVVATHCKVTGEKEYNTSDQQLKSIWDICARTTLLCMQDFFEDGVKRDGILWLGDARLQALCNYACFGETEIVKKSLFLIANSQRADGALLANAVLSGAHGCPHNIDYMFDFVKDKKFSDFPRSLMRGCGMLHYVQYSADYINMVWEYYEASGDGETVKALQPFLKRDLDYLFSLSKEDEIKRLLPSPSQPKVFRAHVDQGGFLSTYYAFLVYALENYKKICTLIGEVSEYDRADKAKAEYTAKVREFFANGICEDTDRDGVIMYPISAPSMAFMAGCLTREEYLCAMDGIKDKDTIIVDGYWMYMRIRAMLEAGLRDEAVAMIRRYWGTMLEHGATTCFEHLDPENLYILTDFVISRCHGWSAGAAELFVRFGIR